MGVRTAIMCTWLVASSGPANRLSQVTRPMLTPSTVSNGASGFTVTSKVPLMFMGSSCRKQASRSCKNATRARRCPAVSEGEKRRDAGPARGVLPVDQPDGPMAHHRLGPRAALEPWIAHFWAVEWSLASPFVALTLPHPTVHLVFEASDEHEMRAEVVGVPLVRFERTLHGDGWVFGIKFRPAAFQPLIEGPVSGLTGAVHPIESVLGAFGAELRRAVEAARDFEDKVAAVENVLGSHLTAAILPEAPLRDLVERMATDREILNVEDAAAIVQMDVRSLQRRFRRCVGVPPKWVIQRYRLHEAAERLKEPSPPSLADLAAELGYFDQAHFARDFRRVVGRTPGRFQHVRSRGA